MIFVLMINKKVVLHFLLFSFFLLLAYPSIQLSGEEKVTKNNAPTLFDMKHAPSDYECLLLANHVYSLDLEEGKVVQYTEKDFIAKKDDSIKERRISYSFLLLQIIFTGGFLAFMLYDFIFYLEKSDTWAGTLKDNYYLLVIGLLKLIGMITLAIDIPLAFEKQKPKIKYQNKDFEKFNEKGWQVLKIFRSEVFKEYASVLYINAEKTKMVLALQGSNSWRDWWYTNWPAVMYQQPKGQVRLMLELLEASIQEAKEYNVDVLTITGHSLGGFLAQICKLLADMHLDKENIHFRAVVYDSPGSKSILDTINCNTENNRIDLHSLDITSYVSSPNLINTMHDHTGSVYMIRDNLSINPSQVAKFHILLAKLFFYTLVSYPSEVFLLFAKKLLQGNELPSISPIMKNTIYWIAPVIMLMTFGYFIYKFNHGLIPTIKNIVYSYQHHSLVNFINVSDSTKGTIDAVEVSYFPKYGKMHQGPGDLFPALPESQLRYAKRVKQSPMGICYVKSKNSSNARFLPIRNVLPGVRIFLQQLDKNYPDSSMRNIILQLLGLPINYVYNSQGILKGVQSTKKDLDIHIIIDRLATLLRKKTTIQND